MKKRANNGDRKIARREKKCLEEHAVFNRTEGRCSSCGACDYGKGRDFSDPENLERGSDGSHQCPPCGACADGYYSKRAVVCSKCRVNCGGYHRNVAVECSPTSDAVCGSCLKGYSDPFYQDTNFPCEEISPSTPESSRHDGQHAQVPMPVDKSYRVGPAPQPLRGSPDGRAVVTGGLLVAGGAILLVLLVVALVWVVRRSRRAPRNRIGHRETALQSDSLITPHLSRDNLSHDNDLMVDAAMETTGEKLARYGRQDSREGTLPYRVLSEPRPELPNEYSMARNPGPRPELSVSYHSQLDAVQIHHQYHQRSNSKKHCNCDPETQCHICSGLLDACSTAPVLRASETLREVASSVCHDPRDLYHNLGIPDADFYQINNDRDRHPEGIPERENIIKLLKRWVEIKDKDATLRVLCTALCDSGFHGITEKIFVRAEFSPQSSLQAECTEPS